MKANTMLPPSIMTLSITTDEELFKRLARTRRTIL
jgi:hypothetical protein